MKRRDEALSMKRIAEIRALQLVAAQGAAVSASKLLSGIEGERDSEALTLGAEQRSWAEAVGGGSFSPELATAWAAAIVRREEGIRGLDDRIGAAASHSDTCKAEWRSADLKARAAEEKARRAGKQAARLREESALGELADRLAGKDKAR
ncbi:hypothetical protein [Allosphingosinicella sp.]|jgi:hypothetical protein|uniref:hypothetical protein n=1 Tax=Allosphingosinicella sp. TaxID=2823234 RepID=UPI002F0FFF6F